MKQFELKIMDGPGKGRTFPADKAPDRVWLCTGRGKRWLALKEPERSCIEITYECTGRAENFQGITRATYEVLDEF